MGVGISHEIENSNDCAGIAVNGNIKNIPVKNIPAKNIPVHHSL